MAAGHDTGVDALRQWDAAVDRMTRNGDLVVTSRLDDRTLPGRSHEYLAQAVDGVPVLGGGVARQIDAAGVAISLLGALHPGIGVDTTPGLSAAEVAARLEQAQGGRLVASRRPALLVLQLPGRRLRLGVPRRHERRALPLRRRRRRPGPARRRCVPESRLRNSWGWRLGAVLNSPGKHPFALDRRLDAGSGGPTARREVEVGLFRRVADRASEHRWVTDAGRAPRGVAGGALVMSPGVRAGRR